MENNTYRLIGATPLSFQLPLKETFVKKFTDENGTKKDLGYRRIIYVPGTDSIYAEDHKGDLQPQQIWFENGDVTVRKDDLLLNKIMTLHPWNGQRYRLWSEETEIEEKLVIKKGKAKARQLVEESNEDEMKAIALAVFGAGAFHWTKAKCELQLLEEADENPKLLMEKFDNPDYNARLIAGYAFVHGIVQENKTQTKVVWSESDGEILKIAKGENGINELGLFLATRTEESELVLQTIGSKLEKIATYTGAQDTATVIDEKDAEIAKLRAQLEGKEDEAEDPELLDARALYVKETGQKVPNNMKNNIPWLLKNAKK